MGRRPSPRNRSRTTGVVRSAHHGGAAISADDDRAIVVGGGICGLSTSLALTQAGIPVTVLERSAELGEVGAGLQVWSNGMEALDRLGLADEIAAHGEPVDEMSFTSWRGKPLVQVRVGALAHEFSVCAPMTLSRPDLLHALARAQRDGTVETGARCVGFEQDAEGVTVHLEGGRQEHGALLIAADGADSFVRRTLEPEAQPVYAGYQYLRALCDVTDEQVPAGTFRFMFGRAHRFGIHAGVYWFGVIVTAPGTVDSASGRKHDLLECFAPFAEPVRSLIEAVPDEAIARTDIRDLDPLERWVHGRVVLVGDAAHATTPNLGRGAGEALEDAVTLAECLAESDSLRGPALAAALAEFERRRRPATASVQTRARRIGQVASWRNPVACTLREVFMRAGMGRAMERENRAEFAALASQRL